MNQRIGGRHLTLRDDRLPTEKKWFVANSMRREEAFAPGDAEREPAHPDKRRSPSRMNHRKFLARGKRPIIHRIPANWRARKTSQFLHRRRKQGKTCRSGDFRTGFAGRARDGEIGQGTTTNLKLLTPSTLHCKVHVTMKSGIETQRTQRTQRGEEKGELLPAKLVPHPLKILGYSVDEPEALATDCSRPNRR